MLLVLAALALQVQPSEWDAGELPGDTRRELEVTIPGEGGRVHASFTSCRCLTVEMLREELPARARVVLETLQMRGPFDGSVTFALDERGDRTVILPVRVDIYSTRPPRQGESPKLLLFYDGWSWDAQRAIDWVALKGQSQNLTHEMRDLRRAANRDLLRATGKEGGLVLFEDGRAFVGPDAVRERVEELAGRVDPPCWDAGEVTAGRKLSREVRVTGGRLKAAIPPSASYRVTVLSESTARVEVDTTGLVGAHDGPVLFVLADGARARMHVRLDVVGDEISAEPAIELLYSGRRPDAPLLAQDTATIARARGVPFAIRMMERPGGARRLAELSLPRTDVWLRDGSDVFVGATAVHRAISARVPATRPPPPAPAADGVRVRLFYFANCPRCAPLLERLRARGGVSLELLELDRPENVKRLMSLFSALGRKDRHIPVALVGPKLLAGFEAIESELWPSIDAVERGTLPPVDLLPDATAAPGIGAESVLAVLGAGVVDGINPCAFVTAVFLVGFLAFIKRGPGTVLAAGLAYVGAVFVTYYAIGLGALAALRFVQPGPWLYAVIALFVGVLAIVSLRDAIVYARTRQAGSVWLQLPLGLKKRIHGAVRSGFGSAGICLGAAGAGFLVTLFETVCTGHMYLPMLAYMARQEGRHTLLALYNLAFIAPLVAVLLLSWAGVRSDRLARFAERNVVTAKVLAACVYAGLGAYLVAAIV